MYKINLNLYSIFLKIKGNIKCTDISDWRLQGPCELLLHSTEYGKGGFKLTVNFLS